MIDPSLLCAMMCQNHLAVRQLGTDIHWFIVFPSTPSCGGSLRVSFRLGDACESWGSSVERLTISAAECRMVAGLCASLSAIGLVPSASAMFLVVLGSSLYKIFGMLNFALLNPDQESICQNIPHSIDIWHVPCIVIRVADVESSPRILLVTTWTKKNLIAGSDEFAMSQDGA